MSRRRSAPRRASSPRARPPAPAASTARNREIGAVVIGAVLLLVAALNFAQAHPDGVAVGVEGVAGLSLIAGEAMTARRRG